MFHDVPCIFPSSASVRQVQRAADLQWLRSLQLKRLKLWMKLQQAKRNAQMATLADKDDVDVVRTLLKRWEKGHVRTVTLLEMVGIQI